MTRRPLSASEKRDRRVWTPLALAAIALAWLIVAGIEGGAIHV